MSCEIKSIVFKIKILTCLLRCRSFENLGAGTLHNFELVKRMKIEKILTKSKKR